MKNLANIITVARLPLLLVILFFLSTQITGGAFWAFLFFIIAAVSDWLDGYVARKYNQVTKVGKILDALIDKVLMIGLFILLVEHDQISGFWGITCLLLIVTRELLITGLRVIAASAGEILAAEQSGKIKTIFQLVSVGCFLFTLILLRDLHLPFDHLAVSIFHYSGYTLLVLATLLTISSGTSYLIKYGHLLKE